MPITASIFTASYMTRSPLIVSARFRSNSIGTMPPAAERLTRRDEILQTASWFQSGGDLTLHRRRADTPRVSHREVAMKRIRYAVAMSLDGYIAGPNGEADWIIMDPEIDFEDIFSQFDTLVMGRRTFEVAMSRGRGGSMPGMKVVVVSRTLRQEDYPKVTILGEDFESALTALRAEPGKDIWLFGGGSLFRSLLDVRLVDTVEVAVIPVLLGGGVPLLPPPARRSKLKLTGSKVYKAGIVSLEYAVEKEDRVSRRRGRTGPKR
jgi:dihydrofolate reductase